jgi:hypothetical protein
MKHVAVAAMKLLAVAAVILVGAAAEATVLVPLDTRALAERADRVVLGTVESTTPRWTSDHQAIYTDVTIRVEKTYKGTLKPGDTVVVRREGGVVDGIGMRVYGAPHFTVGEEVVVFLEKRGGATYTVGMTQGKLRVVIGADGVKRVSANFADVAFTQTPSADAQKLAQPRRLDDFERELGKIVAGSRP